MTLAVPTEKRVIKRSQVNRVNQALVLNLVREHQPISRIDISRRTGLHKSTVTAIVKLLMREKLVAENGSGPSTQAGGRKPRLLSIGSTARKVLGVEIQPKIIKVALADFTGGVRRSWELERVADPERCLHGLARKLSGIISGEGGMARFAGVGVSCPGIVDAQAGELIFSSNLDWRNVPIAGKLQAALGLPVALDNDTFLCAVAERWFGNQDAAEFAFVHVAEGLGVGLVLEGHLRRGFAGGGSHNFGHMTIDFNGPLCRCGNRGCWEAFAANWAIVDRYNRRTRRTKRSTGRVRGIREIIARARAGEKCAVETVEETARYLGIGIANIVNGLNVPAFVVGGDIVEVWPLIEPHLRASVEGHAFMEYVKNVSITPASLGPQSSLMGAVARGLSLQHHTDSFDEGDPGVRPSALRTPRSAGLRAGAF